MTVKLGNDDIAQSRGTDTTRSVSGVLRLDKPCGMTSHDVVDAVRRRFRLRRVGHAGTLDPLASGLLLVMLGRATKIARYLTGMDKVYTTTIRFGWHSTTGDAEGELSEKGDASQITETMIASALRGLTGHIAQAVPAYAAVRARGRRRYELARSGQEVPELMREVDVYSATLKRWHSPEAEIEFHCSSGTYVRALAEALGDAVGCGAHVTVLRRDRIGRWDVSRAHALAELENVSIPGSEPRAADMIESIEAYLPFPRLLLAAGQEQDVFQGRAIRVQNLLGTQGAFGAGDTVVLQAPDGRALAIGVARLAADNLDKAPSDDIVFQYERVLN